MGRSTKKGPFVDWKLLTRVMRQKDTGDREPLKTWSRASTVVPEFVSHTFNVHNGKTFIRVFITEEMVGHKLGEFSHTRTFRGHSGKKAREAAAAAAGGAAPAPAAPAGKQG